MKVITKLSVTDGVSLVTISSLPNDMAIMASILEAVAAAGINVDMMNQSPLAKSDSISFSFTVSAGDVGKVMNVLGGCKQDFPKLMVEINAENTKLCVYGATMVTVCGVAADLFRVLADRQIDVRLITTSETDISVLIADNDTDTAVALLKTHYGL